MLSETGNSSEPILLHVAQRVFHDAAEKDVKLEHGSVLGSCPGHGHEILVSEPLGEFVPEFFGRTKPGP